MMKIRMIIKIVEWNKKKSNKQIKLKEKKKKLMKNLRNEERKKLDTYKLQMHLERWLILVLKNSE